MPHCKVAYCRFNNTHVTIGHKCGPCGAYGHGEIECLYPSRMNILQPFYADRMPLDEQCTVSDCLFKEHHSTAAHHCPICKKRESHTEIDCPLKQITYNVQCPICRAHNTLHNPKQIYGLTDKCSICIERNVEILLPSCYHCCICMECLKRL